MDAGPGIPSTAWLWFRKMAPTFCACRSSAFTSALASTRPVFGDQSAPAQRMPVRAADTNA